MAAQSPTGQTLNRAGFSKFLSDTEGSVLAAWLKWFDTDLELRATQMQFGYALRGMGFPGDIQGTFAVLDEDKSGELALEEIHDDEATLWRRFREFAAMTFAGAKDMHTKLSQLERANTSTATERVLNANYFKKNLDKFGWQGSAEETDLLFHALDVKDERNLTGAQLKWVDAEKRRRRRKETARAKALQEIPRKAKRNQAAAKAALDKFKRYLKHTYGTFIRAWRCALSPHDLMVIQKTPFYCACAEMGFSSDVRLIWMGLGKDDSGSLALDELDSRSAAILAHFQVLVAQMGGAKEAFRALDRTNIKKVREAEFVSSLRELGFQQPIKLLFHGLARNEKSFLVLEDLLFLDRWKPPAFLVVAPSEQAKEEVKQALLSKYGYYLKAWRRCLDLDSSNRCSWSEFQHACKKIGYCGDTAGAWRALDDDMSGYITLKEIDPLSSEVLSDFRRWADEQFGSVRSAFGVFDDDSSNSVTCREFRRAGRIYGYEGGLARLYRALDVEGNGNLGIDEVAFLDDWEFPEPSQEPPTALDVGGADADARTAAAAAAGEAEPGQPAAAADEEVEEVAARTARGARTAAAFGSCTPRVLPAAERVWWNSLPARRTPSSPSPRAASAASARAHTPSQWCARCMTRGSCRHVVEPRTSRSSTPATWRPSDSVEGGAVADVFPVTLDGELRLDRTLRRRHAKRRSEAAAARQRPLLPACSSAWQGPASARLPEEQPRSKSALGSARGVGKEVPMLADVQLMALRHFPMGSVALDKTKKSSLLGSWQSSFPLAATVRTGWSLEGDSFMLSSADVSVG